MCHFRVQNTPVCPEQNFLVQTIIITFIYLLTFFIGQNLKKILTANPVTRMYHFWVQNGLFATNFFLWEIIYIILIYLLVSFIVPNFKKKKKFPVDPELCGYAIFEPKMTHFPENLLMSLVLSFMPIYMPKIKIRYSSISEISMIKQY